MSPTMLRMTCPAVVTIAESDKGFRTSGCQRWDKVD
jgi:hypothetical protein